MRLELAGGLILFLVRCSRSCNDSTRLPLAARHILNLLGVFPQILGSVLGAIRVVLGLNIMVSALQAMGA